MFWIIAVIVIVALTIIMSNKEWTCQYGEYKILVKNTATSCAVIVNGKQIAKGGVFTYSIQGKLENGENIKIKLSQGAISIKCTILIEGREVFSSANSSSDSGFVLTDDMLIGRWKCRDGGVYFSLNFYSDSTFDTDVFGVSQGGIRGNYSSLSANKVFLTNTSSGEEYCFIVNKRPIDILSIDLGFEGRGRRLTFTRDS